MMQIVYRFITKRRLKKYNLMDY